MQYFLNFQYFNKTAAKYFIRPCKDAHVLNETIQHKNLNENYNFDPYFKFCDLATLEGYSWPLSFSYKIIIFTKNTAQLNLTFQLGTM